MKEKKEWKIMGVLIGIALILVVACAVIYAEIARIKRENVADEGMTTIAADKDITSWVVNKGTDTEMTQDTPEINLEPELNLDSIRIPGQIFQNDDMLKQKALPEDIESLMYSIQTGRLVLPEDAIFIDWNWETRDITYQSGDELFVLYYEDRYANVR